MTCWPGLPAYLPPFEVSLDGSLRHQLDQNMHSVSVCFHPAYFPTQKLDIIYRPNDQNRLPIFLPFLEMTTTTTTTTMVYPKLDTVIFFWCVFLIGRVDSFFPIRTYILSSPIKVPSRRTIILKYRREDDNQKIDDVQYPPQQTASFWYTSIIGDEAGILDGDVGKNSTTDFLHEGSVMMADRSHWIVATNNVEPWPLYCSNMNCTSSAKPTRLATVLLKGRTSTGYSICLCQQCFVQPENKLCVKMVTHSKRLSESSGAALLQRKVATWKYPLKVRPGTVCLSTGRSIRMPQKQK